jgi:hypothetical protein
MGWVKDALKELQAGRNVTIRPHGGSMRGRIESAQAVTLAPVQPGEVEVDDVVLVGWQGNYLLHLVKQIEDGRFLIGNNVGKINGWVDGDTVYGRLVAVHTMEPSTRDPASTDDMGSDPDAPHGPCVETDEGNGELSPRMDRTALSVVPLSQADDEAKYWLTKTPEERLRAVEQIRRTLYGEAATGRMEKVLEVVRRGDYAPKEQEPG